MRDLPVPRVRTSEKSSGLKVAAGGRGLAGAAAAAAETEALEALEAGVASFTCCWWAFRCAGAVEATPLPPPAADESSGACVLATVAVAAMLGRANIVIVSYKCYLLQETNGERTVVKGGRDFVVSGGADGWRGGCSYS